MNSENLIGVLAAILDPIHHKQAEEQLAQIDKNPGFLPALFQIVMSPEVSMPIRQVGVTYFKNMITRYWADPDETFTISEEDRVFIRDAIIQAVIQAPELISSHFSVCVNHIAQYDFPARWSSIVEKIHACVLSNDAVCWKGALICLYQLVKRYEYKKAKDRAPLNEAMRLLLPASYQLCTKLLSDQSEHSAILQKQILKIYFAFIHYTLPLDLITAEVFLQWMEIIRVIADRVIPEQTNNVSGDAVKYLIWWKCKKWAIRILFTIFDKYGSPGNVRKEYAKFAEWYLKTFSAGIIEVLLKILEQYRSGLYVSPKVLEYSLNYINKGIDHAITWNLIKPHMPKIVYEIIFPLLSFSAQDEQLWKSDPCEYIRVKYDDYETFVSVAETLLYSCCKKRKTLLNSTMNLISQILKSPTAEVRQRDGALHMLGILIDALRKKVEFKNSMDNILTEYVHPEFSSSVGYIRSRACWVIQEFSEFTFREKNILLETMRLIITTFLTDREIPVKIEAAIALRRLLKYQKEIREFVEPQISGIVSEILKMIHETKSEDLTSVLREIVRTYKTQLMPVAVEMCQRLVNTLRTVLDENEEPDVKAVTAMNLMNTIETLLLTMEDNKTIIEQMYPPVLQILGHIFTQCIQPLYEEALSLVCELTSKSIFPDMWKILEIIYTMFQKDGVEYFTDMMPVLHNYVTVDTSTFLSNENHIIAMFNMCKSVLSRDFDEDSQCHAAKLLEVIILQCFGHIDQCIFPIVETIIQRLNRQVKTSELRTMCLQVVIAALNYNWTLLFQTFEKIQADSSCTEPLFANFMKQWICDIGLFRGLHDRKLCVLGLCNLMNLSPRPEIINSCAGQLIPSLLTLFNGLNRVYEQKTNDSDDESSDEDSEGYAFLASDEDTDKSSLGHSRERQGEVERDEEFEGETELEFYTTLIDTKISGVDEYLIFKDVLQNIQVNDPAWYHGLTAHLTPEQQKSLQEVIIIADQRKAQPTAQL